MPFNGSTIQMSKVLVSIRLLLALDGELRDYERKAKVTVDCRKSQNVTSSTGALKLVKVSYRISFVLN